MAVDASNFFAIRDVVCKPEIVLIQDPRRGPEGFRNSRIGTVCRHRIFGGQIIEMVCTLQAGESVTVPAAFVVPIERAASLGITGPLTVIQ